MARFDCGGPNSLAFMESSFQKRDLMPFLKELTRLVKSLPPEHAENKGTPEKSAQKGDPPDVNAMLKGFELI